MKIFNAMFSKVNGGLEQVFLNYIPALSSQQNQVISIVHPKAQILNECPKENLITVHNFNQHDFLAIHRLKKLVHFHKPDCIITHSYRAAYLFKKIKTKIPKIAVCHVKGHYNFGLDAIIALTKQMKEDIIESGIPKEKVFTVPNLVNLPNDFKYKEPRQNKVPLIGVCARLSPIKGVDIFIKALDILKKRGLAFKAEIAGDGAAKSEYFQLIQDLDLSQEIKLLGWINDRESFYQKLDIFCLPSREESFGLVILESMLHSLPMVLSQLSGPLEIVADSKSALLVPPEDPLKLADALQQVMQNKQLAKELSWNAFQRVQHYSNAKVAPILQEALEKICHGRFIEQ